ncbi:TIGR04283 family arsenosugar biosynthesis glycosyltransferase [Psychrobacter sp. LV10R520-6]|uniref:TIGR04283 family arsenosugar biosynthesis glycosyltransferase n=1 Tax=Psychrobacter sp. LV10R520-6 TaxID=1415574 RepID=UPI002AA0D386|nr:TIGR04283 family arsenosugar biosynthesis glycosyltransferase [Psychrobacter sp. LV10R520-6]
MLATPLTQAVALARSVKTVLRVARALLSEDKPSGYKPSNDNKSKQTSAHTVPPKPVAVSIVIPLLNEADHLSQLITRVATLNPSPYQVILVDGGSTDTSVTDAKSLIDSLVDNMQSAIEWQVIKSAAGRAIQMNTGAAQATGDVLLFLHADTQLSKLAMNKITQALLQADWGRFDVRLDSCNPMLWIVSGMMNARSRLTGIATGDQAIFIKKSLFEQIDGYPNQPLMEDIELCKRLKIMTKPACLKSKVTTSARRWQQYGTWRTIFLMWHLRFDYWRGVSSETLKRRYNN